MERIFILYCDSKLFCLKTPQTLTLMDTDPMNIHGICGGGIPFMKKKPLRITKEREVLQAPCCYTQISPPTPLTANTITAGCPGSLGARFGLGTRKEHLPIISLQNYSVLGQQPWCLGKLRRWRSHAKLLNNLWGKFPLEEKHTLQLTRDQPFGVLGRLESFTRSHNFFVFLAAIRAAASQQ